MKLQRIEGRAAAWAAIVVASGLVAFGCSSGQGSGASKAALDDACGIWATSLCRQQSRCDANEFAIDWKDATDCEARSALSCKQYYEAADTNITASDVEACAATFEGSCDSSEAGSACQFEGTRAAGAG
jgi:hypothetical protein